MKNFNEQLKKAFKNKYPKADIIIKDDVMYNVVKAKFNIKYLKQMLINTGDAELIEGNSWNDTYWGVCSGRGQNKLGKILMRVREELKNG